ncbi:MAG TPA: hypothetical protein VIH63_08315 [Xanthobacteraceae bacterium]
MSDENQFQLRLTNDGPSYFDMDHAFCSRMRATIAAGLENAPIGVITTPGTKNPKYVATEIPPLASSLSDKEFV